MNDPSVFSALILGIDTNLPDAKWTARESIDELAELTTTAGYQVKDKIIQNRATPHPKTYVGPGKLDEIASLIEEYQTKILVLDDELTPAQHKFIESHLNTKVIDRTGLILDIFAQRAHTAEAKLQVELAQLNYLSPRLTNLWTHLSRQSGGIGTRGPGEKQLEVDKRQISVRIKTIKQKLKKVEQHRHIQNKRRKHLNIAVIAGYTNSGKSTLMNRVTKAGVLAENQLFATLDPTTRKLRLSNNETILITDTVGFIQKLPHHLVKAFHATLEGISDATVILHTIDVSSPKAVEMIETSQRIFETLEAADIPQLFVFNKIDKVPNLNSLKRTLSSFSPSIFISAKDDTDFKSLLTSIEDLLSSKKKKFKYRIDYSRMDIVHLLHTNGRILTKEAHDDHLEIEVEIDQVMGEKLWGELYRSDPPTA
ncbi:MAG: GTP-binding protein HflX [Candidatus Marinamargulisbacteria bacterium]